MRRIAPDGDEILRVAQAMVEALASVQRRAVTGALDVSGDELRVQRESIGKTMDFLRGASNLLDREGGASGDR